MRVNHSGILGRIAGFFFLQELQESFEAEEKRFFQQRVLARI
jgi:hypothetical protein